MRESLRSLEDVRSTFSGRFVRFGKKPGWEGRILKTVLLENIYDASGVFICDHLWFNFTKAFGALKLVSGDMVRFDARVKSYEKGYKGRREDVIGATVEMDYKLSRPTKVRKSMSSVSI